MTLRLRHITAAAVALLLTACSTGIDGTGRITANDVKRQVGELSAEQRFLLDVRPEPFASWKHGKRLYVADDRLKLLLGPTAPERNLAGTYIAYRDSASHITPLGVTSVTLNFLTDGGETISYDTGLTGEELRAKQRLDVPFAIEESLVKAVRDSLVGKRYYVLVPDQFTPAGENSRRRKFVPVNITDVRPGNDVYPVAVIFTEEADTPQPESMLYMNVGGLGAMSRSFASLFSFTDPRRRYPAVTEKAWRNIISNTVAVDMTRDECRLALGAPVTVDRYNTGALIVEFWTYENGVYLKFEDGVLKDFRK